MTLSERLVAALGLDRTDDGPMAPVVELPPRPWAEPGRCPRCGTSGEVDVIDLVAGVLHQRCAPCKADWRLRR